MKNEESKKKSAIAGEWLAIGIGLGVAFGIIFAVESEGLRNQGPVRCALTIYSPMFRSFGCRMTSR